MSQDVEVQVLSSPLRTDFSQSLVRFKGITLRNPVAQDNKWAVSSAGRASHLHCECREFDPCTAHPFTCTCNFQKLSLGLCFLIHSRSLFFSPLHWFSTLSSQKGFNGYFFFSQAVSFTCFSFLIIFLSFFTSL